MNFLFYLNRSWTNLIPKYTFPFGLNLQKLNKFKEINRLQKIFYKKYKFFVCLFSIIFSSNVSDQTEKTFLFMMKSEDGILRDDPVIIASNPNQMLYGICFVTNDYIEVFIKSFLLLHIIKTIFFLD